LKVYIANRILYILFYFKWKSFWKHAKEIEQIQRKQLQKLITGNRHTLFGITHNFGQITNTTSFQKQVPISDYDDYILYINKITSGQKEILSCDPIKNFSVSSGTASASKLIPNTKTLIKEFDNCLSVWMFDLYHRFPDLLNGRAFWIITPSTKTAQEKPETAFGNDSDYFSWAKKWLVNNIFAIPNDVALYCEGENYYFVLAIFLLSDKNIRLFSLWNPSLLIILFEKILFYKENILISIETGCLLIPEDIDPNKLNKLKPHIIKNKKRAGELRTIFSSNNESVMWSSIWPHLSVISVWDSAWAEKPAMQLKKLFPNVYLQGKGLLATEACVTFPAFNNNTTHQYLPAYTSHFFEFENTTTSEIKFLHQLKPNETYEVIVTTGGGFYRYRLYDLVTCTGFYKNLPLLRFDGKSNLISDLRGEKLNEKHVSQVIQNSLKELSIESPFYFLAPEISENDMHYGLFLETGAINEEELRNKIEAGLCENFHYKHCRMLNQLSTIKIYCLKEEDINKFYATIQQEKTLSTLKQPALRKEIFWKNVFFTQ
jgi:hypothetical protein